MSKVHQSKVKSKNFGRVSSSSFFRKPRANILTLNNRPELVIVVVVVVAAAAAVVVVVVVDRVKYSTFPNRILSSSILPEKNVKSGVQKTQWRKI